MHSLRVTEWIKTREKISDGDHQRYFDYFDPDMYDPREWAKGLQRRRNEICGIHNKAS